MHEPGGAETLARRPERAYRPLMRAPVGRMRDRISVLRLSRPERRAAAAERRAEAAIAAERYPAVCIAERRRARLEAERRRWGVMGDWR
jgi:hypothetical protein